MEPLACLPEAPPLALPIQEKLLRAAGLPAPRFRVGERGQRTRLVRGSALGGGYLRATSSRRVGGYQSTGGLRGERRRFGNVFFYYSFVSSAFCEKRTRDPN